MRRTVLAAGAAALLASTATIALAQDQTTPNSMNSTSNMPERHAPSKQVSPPGTASNAAATSKTNAMVGERRPERMTKRTAAEERRPEAGTTKRTAVEERRAAAEERRPESHMARSHMRRPGERTQATAEERRPEAGMSNTAAANEERTTVGTGMTTAAAGGPAPGPDYAGGTTYGYGVNYGYGGYGYGAPAYGYGYGPGYGYGGPAYSYGYGPGYGTAAAAYGPNWGAPGQPVYGPVTQPAPVAAAAPMPEPATPVAAAQPVAPAPAVPVEGRAAFVGDDTFTYNPNASDQYTNGNGGHWDAFENENPNGQFSAQQIRSGR